jgi:transcription elongation factor Elf1
MKYISPKVFQKSYTCPHCDAIAQQTWENINWQGYHNMNGTNPIGIGTCAHCEQISNQSTNHLKEPLLHRLSMFVI